MSSPATISWPKKKRKNNIIKVFFKCTKGIRGFTEINYRLELVSMEKIWMEQGQWEKRNKIFYNNATNSKRETSGLKNCHVDDNIIIASLKLLKKYYKRYKLKWNILQKETDKVIKNKVPVPTRLATADKAAIPLVKQNARSAFSSSAKSLQDKDTHI